MDAVVTLQNVADRAGVSRATASMALSGKGRMSALTRQRVREAAAELDYVVNIAARNLRAARSGAVGLYVPDRTLSFKYYMEVAFGAAERAQGSDFLVTLMPTAFTPRSGITDQLDGFLVVDPVDDDPVVERLLAGRGPVVSGEAVREGLPHPWAMVYGDHRAGIRMLLDHLWERGCRRPAATLPDPRMAWGRELEEGYRTWCAEKGVEPRCLLGWFDTEPAGLRRELEEVFSSPGRPDAMITAPEGVALAAVDAIRAAGLTVGRDVLVASCVDNDTLAVTQPTITALDLQPREFGRQGMDLLMRALDGEGKGAAVPVPIRLIERESTAGAGDDAPA